MSRRRRLLSASAEDNDPVAMLTNLFDVAMVFAVALMVAMVVKFNMTEIFSKEDYTMVKNPGKDNMEIITKEGQTITRYKPSENQNATGKKGRKEAAPQPFTTDVPGLSAFVADRLRSYLRDRGFAGSDIEAVLATGLDRLDLLEARLAALAAFRRLPAFESLTAANKRIGNILRKSAGEGGADDKAVVDPALLKEAAERELNDALVKLQPQVQAHLQQQDFTAALQALAALQAPVDAFFEQVMVNAEDPALRRNRLALLGGLHALMNQVADLSQL